MRRYNILKSSSSPPLSLSHCPLPQLPPILLNFAPTQKFSIIPIRETGTDNWSQIFFVGRTQRDLLFTSVQLSTLHSPISSLQELQWVPHLHHHPTSVELLPIHNIAPFTATIKPSGHTTVTQTLLSCLPYAPRLQKHQWDLWPLAGSLWWACSH